MTHKIVTYFDKNKLVHNIVQKANDLQKEVHLKIYQIRLKITKVIFSTYATILHTQLHD